MQINYLPSIGTKGTIVKQYHEHKFYQLKYTKKKENA